LPLSSVHRLALARLPSLKLLDRAANARPDCSSQKIILRDERIGALCAVEGSIVAAYSEGFKPFPVGWIFIVEAKAR